MKKRKQTWAHTLLCSFSKYLEDKEHEDLESLIKETHTKTNQRGFCDGLGFDKLLRLMDPTLNT